MRTGNGQFGAAAKKSGDTRASLFYHVRKHGQKKNEQQMTSNTAERARGRIPRPRFSDSPETGLGTGTLIHTGDGEMPVEYLCAGDRLICRDRGMVRLKSVTRQRATVRAIRFTAGCLGAQRPACDLILPAAQPVLLRGKRAGAAVLVRADQLADGSDVHDLGRCEMVLHQLVFDGPHLLYASGLEVGIGLLPAALFTDAA